MEMYRRIKEKNAWAARIGKTAIIALMVLVVGNNLVVPASAYQYDFNSALVSPWVVQSGSFSYHSTAPSWDGTNYGYTNIASVARVPYSGTGQHFSVSMKLTSVTNDVIYAGLVDNSYVPVSGCAPGVSGYHIIGFCMVGGGGGVVMINGDGFSYSYPGLPNTWYRPEFTILGTNVLINLYSSSGALLDTQTTVLLTTMVPTNITIRSFRFAAGSVGSWDDLTVSGSNSGTISFDKTSYTLGETAGIHITLTNPDYANNDYSFVLVDPDSQILVNLHLSGSGATWDFTQPLNKIGQWVLRSYVLNYITGAMTVMDTAYAVVTVENLAPVLSGTDIEWWKYSYNAFELTRISYQYSADDFSILCCAFSSPRIDIYANGVFQRSYTAADGMLKTSGVVEYPPAGGGLYRADLVRQNLFSDDILSTDTMNVESAGSSIYINNTVTSGVAAPVSYAFTYTPISQGVLNSLIVETLVNGAWQPYKTESLNNVNIQANVPYTTHLTVGAPGNYKVTLFDVSLGRMAYKTFTAISGYIPPTDNLTQSYIRINNNHNLYYYGDILTINYGINTSMYSNGSFSKSVAIFNFDENRFITNLGSRLSIEALEQIDMFQLGVTNGDVIECGPYCYSAHAVFLPGNSSIYLIAKNVISGVEYVLAHDNFTVARITPEGYGLDISPLTAKTKEPISINAFAPGAAVIKIVWNSPTVNNQLYDTIPFNNSISFTTKFGFVGLYTYSLYDLSGTLKQRLTVNIATETPVVTGTPGGTSTGGGGGGQIGGGGDIISLLTSTLFWAFILTVGSMLGIGALAGKSGYNPIVPMVMVGFMGLAVTTMLGWMPMWITASVILVVIVAFAWSLAGKTNTGAQ